MRTSVADLTREVEFVFRRQYGVLATPAAIEAYHRFHDIYGGSLVRRKPINVTTLISEDLDIEAVEFFLRRRYPGNVLMSKLWLCSYLHEMQEGSVKVAAARKPRGPIRSFCILVCLGFWSAFKWLKGALLTIRHNLVCK